MHPLVFLAKQAVETYVKKGEIISLDKDLPKEFLERKSGTFVTIMKNNELRGCIGTYLPTKENIAKEVIYNAIAAATEDWRFGPIAESELSSLSYIVYILSEPELVKDIGNLNPKKYGIIVKTASFKSGLLLPDLEGVDTIEKQISIACQKARINPLEEKILIYRFSVLKFT
jgi:AmmeMemoRadiSam system protein A